METCIESTYCFDCGQEFDPQDSVGNNWRVMQFTPICAVCFNFTI